MILIYIDPYCSGLQSVECKAEEEIEMVLSKAGMDEDSCAGETIYYIFVKEDGSKVEGSLDFT